MSRTPTTERARHALAVVVVMVAAALGTCGSGSETVTSGDLDPSQWLATELTTVPEGYSISVVSEDSTFGRRVSYRRSGESVEVIGSPIVVTTRVPMRSSVADMLEAEVPPGSTDPDAPAEAVVGGQRALVRPVPDSDDGSGWEVVWEPAPAVQVSVHDGRNAEFGGVDSTRESALGLAEAVGGLDRSRWEKALRSHGGGPLSASLPPGAVEREVADGVLDGRQWTLSVRGPVDEAEGVGHCFRLGYAGEDTGPGCSVERVVLAGKGFVLGWIGGGDDPGELVAGPGSSFDEIEPQAHAYGLYEDQYVSIAVLPDGACGVIRVPRAGMISRPLDLLPGDPGSVECSTG